MAKVTRSRSHVFRWFIKGSITITLVVGLMQIIRIPGVIARKVVGVNVKLWSRTVTDLAKSFKWFVTMTMIQNKKVYELWYYMTQRRINKYKLIRTWLNSLWRTYPIPFGPSRITPRGILHLLELWFTKYHWVLATYTSHSTSTWK